MAFLAQQPHMLRHGVEAAESELIGDFLKGRGCALRPLAFLDEVEDLLLFAGQFIHTVWIYSIRTAPAVNLRIARENGSASARRASSGLARCDVSAKDLRPVASVVTGGSARRTVRTHLMDFRSRNFGQEADSKSLSWRSCHDRILEPHPATVQSEWVHFSRKFTSPNQSTGGGFTLRY